MPADCIADKTGPDSQDHPFPDAAAHECAQCEIVPKAMRSVKSCNTRIRCQPSPGLGSEQIHP